MGRLKTGARAANRSFNRKPSMIGHHACRGMQALAVTAGSMAAHAETKVRLVLNWKYERPQGT
jgi:hypothetical protein